jgi:hypothetical protein
LQQLRLSTAIHILLQLCINNFGGLEVANS